jgi:hypothetical protein
MDIPALEKVFSVADKDGRQPVSNTEAHSRTTENRETTRHFLILLLLLKNYSSGNILEGQISKVTKYVFLSKVIISPLQTKSKGFLEICAKKAADQTPAGGTVQWTMDNGQWTM